MAEILTPAQEQAVTDRGGKLLVSAAAGSGKTKVLVDRLLSYITDPLDPCNIDDFLIITFTKAAAAELRSKISQKLTERIALQPESRHLRRQLQRLYLAKISTVHSFCADILRENAYQLDIPSDFRVDDERECKQLKEDVLSDLIQDTYQKLGEDPHIRTFFDSQGYSRDDRAIPEIILKIYESAQCHISPEKWLENSVRQMDYASLTDVSQTPWGQYLLQDLHRTLDHQLEGYDNLIRVATEAGDLDKIASLLSYERSQLEKLRLCKTWDQIIASANIFYDRFPTIRKCSDPERKEDIKELRNGYKAQLKEKLKYFQGTSETVFRQMNGCADAAMGLYKMVLEFSNRYRMKKNQRRVLDFDDLEHKALALLTGQDHKIPTSVAKQIGAGFREIMVDEYQDTNEVQDRIYEVLSADRQNCFMVGDIKQSIYKFRLADPSIFLAKYENYHNLRQQPGQGRRVLLSHNFRSAGPVIQAVNEVFTQCMTKVVGGLDYGVDERLNEGIAHKANDEPEVELLAVDVQAATYEEEASVVADRIAQLLDGTHMVRNGDEFRPIRPQDIAILLRSPKTNLGAFSYALQKRGIRFTTGGGIDLMETEEIITLHSILQVISNPQQDVPLLAVLTSRVFMYTADQLAQMRIKKPTGSIYDALCFQPNDQDQAFLSVLQQLREYSKYATPSEMIRAILSVTRLDSIFGADPDGVSRISNIYAYSQLAVDFESYGQKSIDAFLEHLNALSREGLILPDTISNSDAVTIMSIHKSKGLEFPVVFLCCISKSINERDVTKKVLCDKDLGIGLNCVDMENRIYYPSAAKNAIATKLLNEGLSEEMRILYVAMTRARDRLIMTYADQHLDKHLSDISRQLDLCSRDYMIENAWCLGYWVLMVAMQKTEAGALFAISRQPENCVVSPEPWLIQVISSSDDPQEDIAEICESTSELDPAVISRLQKSLAYRYHYPGATEFPSKQTATQLKGRVKDQEAAEDTQTDNTVYRKWRKPKFVEAASDPTRYGNAVHRLMQYADLSQCQTSAGLSSEMDRLVQERFLSSEERTLIDPSLVVNFLQTWWGRKLIAASNVLREFKFSILDDALEYGCDIPSERILLQGVVDCAIVEEEGIYILDFKTDRIHDSNRDELIRVYSSQVRLYSRAMERIFERKVLQASLYFFRSGEFVQIEL